MNKKTNQSASSQQPQRTRIRLDVDAKPVVTRGSIKRSRNVEITPKQDASIIGIEEIWNCHVFPELLFERIISNDNENFKYYLSNFKILNLINLINFARTCTLNLKIVIIYLKEVAKECVNLKLDNSIINLNDSETGIPLLLLKGLKNNDSYFQKVITAYSVKLNNYLNSQPNAENEQIFENITFKNFKRMWQTVDNNALKEAFMTNLFQTIENYLNNNNNLRRHCKHLGMLAKNAFITSQPAIFEKVINFALSINLVGTQLNKEQLIFIDIAKYNAQAIIELVIDFVQVGLVDTRLVNKELFTFANNIVHYKLKSNRDSKEFDYGLLEIIIAINNQKLINDINHPKYLQLVISNYSVDLERHLFTQSDSPNADINFENGVLEQFKSTLQAMNVDCLKVLDMNLYYQQIVNSQDLKEKCMHIKHLSILARNGFIEAKHPILAMVMDSVMNDPVECAVLNDCLMKMVTDFIQLDLVDENLVDKQLLSFVKNRLHQLKFETLELISSLTNKGLINNLNHELYAELIINYYLLALEQTITNKGIQSNRFVTDKKHFETTIMINAKKVLQEMNLNLIEVLNINQLCQQIIKPKEIQRQCMHINHLSMLARHGYFENLPAIFEEIIDYTLKNNLIQQIETAQYLRQMVIDFVKAGLLSNSSSNQELSRKINDICMYLFSKKNVATKQLEMISALAQQGLLDNSYTSTRVTIKAIFSQANEKAKTENHFIETMYNLIKAGLFNSKLQFEPSNYPHFNKYIISIYQDKIKNLMNEKIYTRKNLNSHNEIKIDNVNFLVRIQSIIKLLNPKVSFSSFVMNLINERIQYIKSNNFNAESYVYVAELINALLDAGLLDVSSVQEIISISKKFLEVKSKEPRNLKIATLNMLNIMVKFSLNDLDPTHKMAIKPLIEPYLNSRVNKLKALSNFISKAIQ